MATVRSYIFTDFDVLFIDTVTIAFFHAVSDLT